jgi:hypothetical protein
MDWKTKTIAVGLGVGLIIGLAGAYIVIQRAEREGNLPMVTTGDGVKIGLGVLGVLRLVADLADRE